MFSWHSLKPGPEARDLGPEAGDSGTLGIGTCDPGTWDPANGTLGPRD